MAQTTIRGAQILNSTIQRQDLDTTTVGQAVVAKILQGSNVTLSSTGGDSGTGDVTITATPVYAYTTATAGFTVPSVGSTVVASVVDSSWAILGEVVWVQDSNGAGVGGTLLITAKTSNSLTLKNVSGAGN